MQTAWPLTSEGLDYLQRTLPTLHPKKTLPSTGECRRWHRTQGCAAETPDPRTARAWVSWPRPSWPSPSFLTVPAPPGAPTPGLELTGICYLTPVVPAVSHLTPTSTLTPDCLPVVTSPGLRAPQVPALSPQADLPGEPPVGVESARGLFASRRILQAAETELHAAQVRRAGRGCLHLCARESGTSGWTDGPWCSPGG